MAGEPVLVVDDNSGSRKLLRVLLTLEAYEVRTAGNAREALEVLERFRPRLILMDLQMPDMDGLTLTRRIKADPRYAGILILAVTAAAMKGDDDKARAAGCDGYLSKPLDTKTFPDVIRALLDRREGTGGLP